MKLEHFFEPQILIEQPNIKNGIFWQIKNFQKKIIQDNLGDFDSVISQQSNDTKTIALVQLYEEFWAFEVGSTRNSHN